MTRFPTAAHLASWSGTCPGSNESAGRVKATHTRPGNPHPGSRIGNRRFYQDLGGDYYTRRKPERYKNRAIRQLREMGYDVTLAPAKPSMAG